MRDLSISIRRHAMLATGAAAVMLHLWGVTGAQAAKIVIACQKSDIMNSAWAGPMTLDYAGEETGTLTVKAAFGEMTLPAAKKGHETQIGQGQAIDGFGMMETTMPDLAALESCIASKMAPGEDSNDDSYLNARDACLSDTPPSTAPVKVKGQVKVGLIPGDMPEEVAVIVEVRRTYDAQTNGPKGTTTIESFPANCSIVGN